MEKHPPLTNAIQVLTLLGMLVGLATQVWQCAGPILNLSNKLDLIQTRQAEQQQKLESIEDRGIHTADRLEKVRQQMADGLEAVRADIAKKADKRGRP